MLRPLGLYFILFFASLFFVASACAVVDRRVSLGLHTYAVVGGLEAP